MNPKTTTRIIQGGLLAAITIAVLTKKSTVKELPPGIITQHFSAAHKAVDISMPVGTDLRALAPGYVLREWYTAEGGYQMLIQHPNKVITGYAHLSKYWVRVGDKVSRFDLIAKSGNTGHSTGPHLHFVLNVNGIAVDPLKYMKAA